MYTITKILLYNIELISSRQSQVIWNWYKIDDLFFILKYKKWKLYSYINFIY